MEKVIKNKKILLIALLVLLGIIGISYAWYTLVINKDTSLNLRGKTGLDITLVEPSNPIVINTAIPMSDADGLATTAYQFKVVSNDSENIAYQLYLDDVELESGEHKIPDSNIKYSLTKNGGNENPALLTTTHKIVGNKTVRELDDTIINGKTANTAVENVYTLKLWIDSEATTAISGYKFKAKLRLEATQTEDSAQASINPHIKAVYKYNQDGSGEETDYTGCLGGSEAGCSNIVSTINKNTTYGVGDIVKYEVADGVEKYFNVLYDNGSTLTLQQRENTIANTAWYSPLGNSQGPTTILSALETSTNGWNYVNNQTYTFGATTFGKTTFSATATGCIWTKSTTPDSSSCTIMQYPSFTKTDVKARLITAQEAGEMNCQMQTLKTCKKFMNNYLKESKSNGGSFTAKDVKGNNTYGYWTMTAKANDNDSALYVSGQGNILSNYTTGSDYGARAVVEINK